MIQYQVRINSHTRVNFARKHSINERVDGVIGETAWD